MNTGYDIFNMENTNYLTLSRNIGSTVKRRLLKALKKTGQINF